MALRGSSLLLYRDGLVEDSEPISKQASPDQLFLRLKTTI
jgi:hypothetical protein